MDALSSPSVVLKYRLREPPQDVRTWLGQACQAAARAGVAANLPAPSKLQRWLDRTFWLAAFRMAAEVEAAAAAAVSDLGLGGDFSAAGLPSREAVEVEEEDEASEAVARSTTTSAAPADAATAAAGGVFRFLEFVESTSRVGVVVDAKVVWVMSSSSEAISMGSAGGSFVGETNGGEVWRRGRSCCLAGVLRVARLVLLAMVEGVSRVVGMLLCK